ncbi:hypothetical protein [Clostridium perfringens]|uniref:hypothetical protein n=1 Tax=Clostridium perfringens TaxID=1502 RepID=UPI003D3542D2
MLGTPKHGWVDINIGDFEGRGSYLDDVAMNFLNAFISSYTYGIPACVEVDEEGTEFTVISNNAETTILINRDNTSIEQISINRDTLSKELLYDIESNLDGWANWFSYLDLTQEELIKRKNDLKDKICILKELINKKDEI